jgi:hypothetical protein
MFPRSVPWRGSLVRTIYLQIRGDRVYEPYGRDVLVSSDEKAFIRHGKRAKLEALCLRIVTVAEFCASVEQLAAKD